MVLLHPFYNAILYYTQYLVICQEKNTISARFAWYNTTKKR
jgi:hypothetical protein